jgi:hypothetical protein
VGVAGLQVVCNTSVRVDDSVPANTNVSYPFALNVTNMKDWVAVADSANVSIYTYKGGAYKETINVAGGSVSAWPGVGAKPLTQDVDTIWVKNNSLNTSTGIKIQAGVQ